MQIVEKILMQHIFQLPYKNQAIVNLFKSSRLFVISVNSLWPFARSTCGRTTFSVPPKSD
jgi:hypothetical protein